MLPHKHAMISATIGAISWWGTGESAVGAAAFVAGVLPDVDHIIDYTYYYWRGEHRFILPLHAYEFAILGTVIAFQTNNTMLAIAVLAYFIHLLADQAENQTRGLGYFLLYRAWNRFRPEDISTIPEDAVRGRMNDINSLKSLLRRWQA